jgi:aminopeptidase N
MNVHAALPSSLFHLIRLGRLLLLLCLGLGSWHGSLLAQNTSPGLADTLRGSITPERAWWNVLRYDLAFAPHYEDQYIEGNQRLVFNILGPGSVMQIDLQAPMRIDEVRFLDAVLPFRQMGNAWYLDFAEALPVGDTMQVDIQFSGKPRAAVNPPWDGGWIWGKDKLGRPWMSVACQGLGASVWFPCKDHQSDEPDLGASMSITVPDSLVAVANGRLMGREQVDEGLTGFAWEVENPINTYNMVPYIGIYSHWSDDFEGLKGSLDLDFWVLDYELKAAKKHFVQVNRMLACFEDWLGPYPFYEDGYKLVQAPHLGMEHQSAIAYGNHFGNGYRGTDLSGSGWGMKWDFIIVHESGHEWFGNSITTKDIADMWVHESFTAYTETLMTECNDGISAAEDYVIGTRRAILNDKPIIGPYEVNRRGSGDMYYKGANMIHNIRHVMDNDSLFKAMLRGLNSVFYHRTVTGAQVEGYINDFSGIDFSKVFEQYLRHTEVPVLEYQNFEGKLYYRWAGVVEGFDMPLKLVDGTWLKPTLQWQATTQRSKEGFGSDIDRNFYVLERQGMAKLPPKVD